MVLRLLRPAVDVEFRPLVAYGGVGGGTSSERPPKEPMVDERPRIPRRMGVAFGDERADWIDFVESLRNNDPAAGEPRFIEAAVRAICEGEGIGDDLPFSRSCRRALLMAVSGGLSPGE